MDPYTYAITPPSASSGGVAETEVPLLQQIANGGGSSGSGGNSQGFVIVNGSVFAYDYQTFEYFGSTNNVKTITYRSGGAGGSIVAVQRLNYVGGGVSDDDSVSVIATTST